MEEGYHHRMEWNHMCQDVGVVASRSPSLFMESHGVDSSSAFVERNGELYTKSAGKNTAVFQPLQQWTQPMRLLTRPKPVETKSANQNTGQVQTKNIKKSLEQREKEYAAARMRILGNVRFPEEEQKAELEVTLTPAEMLKRKIREALCGDGERSVS